MNGRILAGVTLALLAAVSCGDDGGDAGAGSIVGPTWILDRASIDQLAPGAPDDARVDAVFDAERVAGTSGCNRYGGAYTVDGATLAFGDLLSTEMACDEPLMTLEAAFVAALGGVRSFEADSSTLALRGDGIELRFEAEAPAEPEPLVGTTWILGSLGGDGDTVSSPLAGTEVTLELRDDGSASGNAGCNTFRTSYTLDGDALSFEPAATTRKACADDVMAQEAQVLAALEATATYATDGAELTLRDDDGTFLVSFRTAS
jgi:heat shock protein HslJ